jgi:hypothetical protein
MEWQDGASSGDQPVLDYSVFYDLGDGFGYKQYVQGITLKSTTFSVDPALTYKFAVTARSVVGNSAYSNEVTICTRDVLQTRQQWCLANDLFDALMNSQETKANEIIDRCFDYYGQNFISIDEQRQYGFTVLHWASYRGYDSTTTRLLRKGANTDIQDSQGYTPLMRATRGQHVSVANLLLDKNAGVNQLNSHKMGSLFFAAMYGFTDLAERLLQMGALVD